MRPWAMLACAALAAVPRAAAFSGARRLLGRHAQVQKRREAIRIAMAAESAPRVRFAPSPTGTLHVGGARTALYNYLVARKYQGEFLLRVEDTDLARSTRESEESMAQDLKWLGLAWDEGPGVDGPHAPYRQSERGELYKKEAEKLLASGHAYPCFCSEEELDAKRAAAEEAGVDPTYDGTWRDADPEEVQAKMDAGEPYTVRFRVPAGEVVTIADAVRGDVSWDAEKTVGDFILLRSSGVPVYNFCVAVDDADMQVTTVIRAEEHLTNTLRQCLILDAMGAKRPNYAHCSLILGEDRSKLSKRHGATSVDQFRRQGYVPEAMINYLTLLGWNDGTDKEIYTRDELIEAFDLDRVVKSPSVFDSTKLTWVNGQHLRALALEDLGPRIVDFLTEDAPEVLGDASPQLAAAFGRAAGAVSQPSMNLLADTKPLLEEVVAYDIDAELENDDAKALVDAGFAELAAAVVAAFEAGELPLPDADALAAAGGDGFGEWEAAHADAFKKWVKKLGKDTGRKGKGLFQPVRLALTGSMSGPDIGAQLRLLAAVKAAGATLEAPVVAVDARMEKLKSIAAGAVVA